MDIEPHFITAGAGFAGLILGFALRPLALAYGARWPFALCVPVMAALGVTAGLVTPAPLTGMALALAVFILFASGVIDYQTKRIPNLLVLALIVVAALSSGFGLIMPWDAGLIGAALGVGLLLLVDFIYRLRGRGRGVGMGDIKLMVGLGGLVGPIFIVWILLGASLLQILAGGVALARGSKLSDTLPFGPALAITGIAVLVWMMLK